jgi:tetratricopeptide (TPR) repeat protein
MWFIEYSRFNADEAWFSWHILAMKKWEAQSHTEALTFWVQALLLSPKEFKLLYNIGIVHILSRRMKLGMEYIKKAEENIPKGQEKMANMLIWKVKHGEFTILV